MIETAGLLTTPKGVTVFTSYHAQAPKLGLAGVHHISISQGIPRWSAKGSYSEYKKLAPPFSLIHTPAPEYAPIFRTQLEALDANAVIADIEELARQRGVDKVALCCFEKPTDFCHRFMVAEWLEQKTGIIINEWSVSDRMQESTRILQRGFYD